MAFDRSEIGIQWHCNGREIEMAKTYTDELTEWTKKRATKCRGTNLVTFLGLRDDVKAAIDAGFSTKTIWSNMHESGRVTFGYDAFLNYVNRLIKKRRDAKSGFHCADSVAAAGTAVAPVESVEPPLPLAVPSSKPATPAQPPGMPTFKFNPIPSNREESK